MIGNDLGTQREIVRGGNCHQRRSVTFCSFFNHWISNGFLRFHCRINVLLWSIHACTDTQTYSQNTAFPQPPTSLSPCPSLSQIYFIINQLVAHLPACCVFFFPINKALIAFSVECDLAHCVLSLWGRWPWETRLDFFTAALSPGCYQTAAHSQVPHSRHTAANTNTTPRDKDRHTHRVRRTMAGENNVYFECKWKRKDVELEGNQAGKLKSKDKNALRLHHKQGNYGIFQNRGQEA